MTITPPRPVAELAERIPGDDVVDADDVISAMELLGVDERTARERYGMSLAALGRTVLVHVRQRRAPRGARRAPARRAYITSALLRCALYLGPLSVAVAAARPLGRVAWPVPIVTLLLGWSAAQALTSVGLAAAKRSGAAAAARLVGGGFLAAAALWAALAWIAPQRLLGDRWLAAEIGAGGLAALATVTVALVTGTEAAVIRWSLPCWLLAAVTLAGSAGDGWADRVPTGVLLPAVIGVALLRALRPVLARDVPTRTRLGAAELRRAVGFLLIGAAQALCVALLWRAGPPGATSPAALPLLAAVPLLEALVGWHTRQVESGLDTAESKADYGRHVRAVATVTVAGLLPPLAAGAALAVAAYRLPYGLSAMDGTRDGVLALAAGTLLGGVLAATFLLAARGRTGLAAAVAAAPPLATVVLPLLPVRLPDRLPLLVVVLAATHLAGLLTIAHTAADPRRPS